MRIVSFLLLTVSLFVFPAGAYAQSSAQPSPELALGPHLLHREHSSGSHVGGAVTVARPFGRLAGVLEAGGTRREGHNDWRLLAGVRAALVDGGRASVFVQGLVGTLIRQRSADWAVMPGLGVDLHWSETRAIRFQFDVPIERSEARTASGVRGSIWLVFLSR